MSAGRRLLLVAALGLGLAALAATVVAARAAAVLAAHRQEILAAVASFIGWPVEAESLSVSWWPPGVIAHQVQVPDESPYGPGTLAYAEEARFEIALLPLLRGRFVVTDVHLQAPALRVVRGADGSWNLARRGAPAPLEPREAASGRTALAVVVETVRVRGARLSYRDRAIPGLGDIEVRAVNLRLTRGVDATVIDFNAQAFGGPEENVSGVLRIENGAERSAQAVLHIDAEHLEAARLPEVVEVLRGYLPAGLSLGGEVAARVDASMPATWPPGTASIDLEADARQATVRAAAGWIEKRPGSRLEATARLRAGDFGLALDRAVLRLGDSELRAEAEGDPGESGQPPLRFALDPLDAATLVDWVPSLAPLKPGGRLEISGSLALRDGPIGAEVRVAGGPLRLAAGGERLAIGSSELRVALSAKGDRVLAGLRLGELAGGEVRLATLNVGLGGPLERPLTVRIDAAQGAFRGAAIDRLGFEGALLEDRLEVRALRATGLGGALTVSGSVARAPGGVFHASLAPEWEGLDAGALLGLAGLADAAQGTLSGRARLETEASDVASALAKLSGDFELTLARGALPGLNVASATLGSLDRIPRLKEAIERRAAERIPGLVAQTTEISLLSLRGEIASGAVDVKQLGLESEDYTLAARGRISFDGETNLSGTLTLARAVTAALSSESIVAAVLASPGGDVRIPIAVRGRYPRLGSAPTSDFLARATARAILPPAPGSGAELLRQLFHGRSD